MHTEAIALLKLKLESLKRKAWLPETIDEDGSLTDSKFSGKPWLSADETYPRCPVCRSPLRFFLQLNLNKLPEELGEKFGNGLFQLFYCTNGDCDCQLHEIWEPNAICKLVRIVKPEGSPSEVVIPSFPNEYSDGEFVARRIVSWLKMEDYPIWEEAELLGVQCDRNELCSIFSAIKGKNYFDLFPDEEMLPKYYDYWKFLNQFSFRGNAITNFMMDEEFNFVEKDKLAGFPHWVQDVEYPDCPICNQKMDQLNFEFASGDHVPYLWGDVGTGYVLQCPDHKDQVTFIWQC